MISDTILDCILKYAAEAGRTLFKFLNKEVAPLLKLFVIDLITRKHPALALHLYNLVYYLFQLIHQFSEFELRRN